MLRKNRLFTPGPTPLLPSAQNAMTAAVMHHRTADFKALFSKALTDLKVFIGTKNDVILLASSGTGAMEASVTNLTAPGDKVLVLTAGKFGERWRDLGKTWGCNVDVVSAPYGAKLGADAVREKLAAKDHGIRVVYMQATESSTGVRHDVQGVAKLVQESNARGGDTLLVVDAITGLGTTTFDVDGWGIDVIIGGSQKALMIPPGLAYLAVSDRAWKRMDQPHSPSYYFDLRKERKSQLKGETAFTPAITLVAGLAAALDFVRAAGNGDLAAGREALINNAETCAAMTRAAAAALGLKLFSPDGPCAALTAIKPPDGLDSGVIVKAFRESFDAVVANGQGDEMKGKMFRIAHIGLYDYLDTIGVIAGLEQVLAKVAPALNVQFGTAVKAAQEVYAKAVAQAGKAEVAR
jgi:aspartate aminotransferase-like enzyme